MLSFAICMPCKAFYTYCTRCWGISSQRASCRPLFKRNAQADKPTWCFSFLHAYKPHQSRRLVRPNLQDRAPLGEPRAALVIFGAPLAQVVQALIVQIGPGQHWPCHGTGPCGMESASSRHAWVVVSPSVPGRSTTPLSTFMPAQQQGSHALHRQQIVRSFQNAEHTAARNAFNTIDLAEAREPGMMPWRCSTSTSGVPSEPSWYSVSSNSICGTPTRWGQTTTSKLMLHFTGNKGNRRQVLEELQKRTCKGCAERQLNLRPSVRHAPRH